MTYLMAERNLFQAIFLKCSVRSTDITCVENFAHQRACIQQQSAVGRGMPKLQLP